MAIHLFQLRSSFCSRRLKSNQSTEFNLENEKFAAIYSIKPNRCTIVKTETANKCLLRICNVCMFNVHAESKTNMHRTWASSPDDFPFCSGLLKLLFFFLVFIYFHLVLSSSFALCTHTHARGDHKWSCSFHISPDELISRILLECCAFVCVVFVRVVLRLRLDEME